MPARFAQKTTAFPNQYPERREAPAIRHQAKPCGLRPNPKLDALALSLQKMYRQLYRLAIFSNFVYAKTHLFLLFKGAECGLPNRKPFQKMANDQAVFSLPGIGFSL